MLASNKGLSLCEVIACVVSPDRLLCYTREIELMGFASPTSARYKNRDYNGRQIDSVKGFVDMSRGLNFEEQAHREREREDAERKQRKLEEDHRLRTEKEEDDDDEKEYEDEEYDNDDNE